LQNPEIKITNHVLAEINIFKGHHTTIKNGFNAFCNIGTIRSPAIFHLKEDCVRSGDKIMAELLFSKPICPVIGTQFIFREGLSIGYGIIKEIL
jgi:GTPase